MDTRVAILPELPPLAWVAAIDLARSRARVLAGNAVEVSDSMIAEACWSGSFDAGGLENAATVSGTALTLHADRIKAFTSSDTLQPIFELRTGDDVAISNSLVLLLEATEARLLDDYAYYDSDLMSVFLGLRTRRAHIPLAQGKSVHVHYHCTVQYCEGATTVLPRRPPPAFATFAAYRAFLGDQVRAVVANASANPRKTRYLPLATVSSGYDSTCGAALAREAGCDEAITFSKANQYFDDQSDSGAAVAAALGMRIQEFDPAAYLCRDDLPEVEFVATGMGADDVIFAGLEPSLRGRLLFTGYHGDKVWSRERGYVSDDIARGDPSGGSLLEFRLRAGFQNLAIPFIGCVRHSEICAISNAGEMKRWQMDVDYDRPIARRIAEEAGVPRQMFGQTKKAAARPYLGSGGYTIAPANFLSARTLDAFDRYLVERAPIGASALLLHNAKQRLYGSYKLKRGLEAIGLRFDYRAWRYSKTLGASSFMFHWAFERCRLRYATARGLLRQDYREP